MNAATLAPQSNEATEVALPENCDHTCVTLYAGAVQVKDAVSLVGRRQGGREAGCK